MHEFNGETIVELVIYDDSHVPKQLIFSNTFSSGDQVLNSLAPYGWELAAINKDEYNVKRPYGSFTNISFFVFIN